MDEELELEDMSIEFEIDYAFDLPNIVHNPFYDTKYYLSPTALSKFLFRPKAWYDWYVLKQKEDRNESNAQIEGSLIHLLMLEPHKFDDKYIIDDDGLVSGVQKKIIDKVFTLVSPTNDSVMMLLDYKTAILREMEDENYFQALVDDKKGGKTGDEKRIEKIVTPQAHIYWEFLKKKNGKRLISQKTYDYCSNAATLISSRYEYRILLGLDEEENVEVFNEIEVAADLEFYEIGFKGVIDNLVVDHNTRKIRINDIKTTEKLLEDFGKTIEFYGYDYQITIYGAIVSIIYKELFDQGYELECNFIVVNKYGDTYAFKVSDATLSKWYKKLTSAVKEFEWCYSNKEFTNFRKYMLNEHVL